MNDTDNEVWRAVNTWLRGVTNLTVIRGWQSAQRPARPYIMSNFLGSLAIHEHEIDIEYEEDEVSERILARPIIETEWRFSLHAYSETPTDLLRPVRNAARLLQAQEPMYPSLVVFEANEIRNVPDWQNEDWEPRAQMDFNVRGLTNNGVLIDTIDTYSFNWTRI